MDTIFDGEVPRARLALLLRHFSELKDNREPWRIVYPLQEVLLLVTCATIASCDDFDDIVAWGKHHLAFLRHFSEFHHGIPCERWLRALLNRIDPILFGRCFNSWIAALWPNRHEFIAIDGKTSRRTHDQRKGLKALHTLSAYATHARLTLAQWGVPKKTNETTAIPDLLDQLAETKQLEGALVTIDAMGCQVEIADKIVAHKADYLLPLKGNNPPLKANLENFSRPPPQGAPTPPRSRCRGLFPHRPRRRTCQQNHRREGTWPDRDAHLHRLQQGRLDNVGEKLPGPTALQEHQYRREGSRPRRICRSLQLRYPPLYLVRAARYRTHRQGRARSLGHREHALAARCRIQGRSVALSDRPRSQEHDYRPPLRSRPRACQ